MALTERNKKRIVCGSLILAGIIFAILGFGVFDITWLGLMIAPCWIPVFLMLPLWRVPAYGEEEQKQEQEQENQ